MMGLVLV